MFDVVAGRPRPDVGSVPHMSSRFLTGLLLLLLALSIVVGNVGFVDTKSPCGYYHIQSHSDRRTTTQVLVSKFRL